jgi:hypothetical protein
MSKLHDPVSVAKAIGCPVANVTATLPSLIAGLTNQGILEPYVLIGLIATCKVESASTFKPVEEAFWLSESVRNAYFDKTAYGKLDPVTHKRYFGRGHIQRTWKTAYESDGKALGIDLVNHPELLLQPDISAKDACLFWKNKHGLVDACKTKNTKLIRKLVNGGYNDYDSFLIAWTALAKLYESSKP